MKEARHVWLVFQALYEIARYEAILRLRGSGYILRSVRRQLAVAKSCSPELERAVCDAVLFATCLHWKPVLCLQRSICTARLLRRHGADAHVVMGYRPLPFFCHAWVQVE